MVERQLPGGKHRQIAASDLGFGALDFPGRARALVLVCGFVISRSRLGRAKARYGVLGEFPGKLASKLFGKLVPKHARKLKSEHWSRLRPKRRASRESKLRSSLRNRRSDTPVLSEPTSASTSAPKTGRSAGRRAHRGAESASRRDRPLYNTTSPTRVGTRPDTICPRPWPRPTPCT